MKEFSGVQELKNLSGSTQAFSPAYKEYGNVYNYLSKTKSCLFQNQITISIL